VLSAGSRRPPLKPDVPVAQAAAAAEAAVSKVAAQPDSGGPACVAIRGGNGHILRRPSLGPRAENRYFRDCYLALRGPATVILSDSADMENEGSVTWEGAVRSSSDRTVISLCMEL
jgi:hypothetical protein